MREGEACVFVAAGSVSLEAGTVQIIGAAQSRVLCLSGFIPADEDAVMMYRILIQQTGIQKLSDHLGSDTSLTEIGEDPAVIRIAGRQGKLLFRADRLWLRNGRVSGFPMEGQKVLHRFRKGFSAKLLEEGNGIPAGILGIPEPGTPILDPQAVHLRGSMEASHALHLIAEVGEQLRQVRFSGDLHFCVCEAISDLACHNVCLLSDETQKATQGIRYMNRPRLCGQHKKAPE